MKVCIYGAGAIGGFIGTRLAARAGCEVSAVARGATLAALRAHGWRLQQGDELITAPCHASDDPAELGAQDLVVIAVKGPALPAVAAGIAPLLAPHTLVLPAMNGVPWWFAAGVPVLASAPLDSIDPGGRVAAAIPLAQVLGCVVHASTFTPEPGLVGHRMGQGLIVGEPAGGVSPRATALGERLRRAGFDTTVSADIRKDAWYKLWGNLTMNPITAITGATADRVLDDPLVRGFCSAAMREMSAVGARIGCAIDQSPDDRHAITRKLGAFRTSMEQDVAAGRPIELDAIVAAVVEIARRVDVPTPAIDVLLGLTRLFGRVHGLYP
ncbi:2-dehydropantoate 2-reductase [Ideonella sp. A 288]|uniref:2-dehydropantoate 2-reductase n=1 Tax=Ideonella sp. A 288 TaxID=1962181 RepID=UPI000B4BE181|nr:2-dehydropantoate 2-reductase [Ideonella sp. A 288]